MKNTLQNIETYSIQLATNFAPYTNLVGLARSILAVGTMLTMMLNPAYYFFNKSVDGVYFNPLLDLEKVPMNHFNFFLIFGVDNAALMKWIAVLILLVVVSGYFMKITSILHWWIAASFMLSSSVLDGGDQIAAILSFLLIPICLTDPRKNHWHILKVKRISPKNLLAILSVWLIRLQVAVIYFDASVGKFPAEEWANGTALYYWLNHSSFGITDIWRPLLNPILSDVFILPLMTYGVMLLELALFLALLASVKYRKRILPFALGFHFFIIIFHGIFSFFFSIAAAAILYLYPTYEHIVFKRKSKEMPSFQQDIQKPASTKERVSTLG